MNIDEAKKLVGDYGDVIANNPMSNDKFVRPISHLPCSPARLKLAFLILTEHLLATGGLKKSLAESLEHAYACIDTAYREEADEINEVFQELFLNGSVNRSKLIEKMTEAKDKYRVQTMTWPNMPSSEAQIEYHNFISEWQHNN